MAHLGAHVMNLPGLLSAFGRNDAVGLQLLSAEAFEPDLILLKRSEPQWRWL